MFYGRPLTIYVISLQPWAGFKLSKHHYAEELARLGHDVYFIEPTISGLGLGAIQIEGTEVPGIRVVRYAGRLLRWLRFNRRDWYDAVAKRKIRQIITEIEVAPDIVWDFDGHYQFADLAPFGDGIKIFHPVDSLLPGFTSHKNADVLLSLSQDFVEAVGAPTIPTRLIPHGLNRIHENRARAIVEGSVKTKPKGKRKTVGYVGNLDMPGIDWPILLEMMERYSDVDFKLIGPHAHVDKTNGNKGAPISALERLPNCTLTGRLSVPEIVNLADGIDIWLVCYDVVARPDGAINSHKVLEYLATGKAVLSNWMEAHEDTGLVAMPAGRQNRDMIPLLGELLAGSDNLNTWQKQRARAEFALQHSYECHVATISTFLEEQRNERARPLEKAA